MQELTTFLPNHAGLTIALVAAFIFLLIIELIRARQKRTAISPLETTQMLNHDQAVIIDLRSADLFAKGHIIGALRFSAKEIADQPKKIEKWKARPIIIACQQGVESQKIAALLSKRGYNVYTLAGGMRAWNDAQLPLVKE